jgi:FkbM family methyltransferase
MQRLRSGFHTSRWGRAAKGPIQRFVGAMGYEIVPKRKAHDQFVLGLIQRQGIDVLVDVGANQGQYARGFRERGFRGRMVSFEPLPQAFQRLRAASLRDGMWEVRRLAIGSHCGVVDLHVAANSVSSSLLPIGELHVQSEPTSRLVGIERVEMSTLDDQFAQDSSGAHFWLKLDVQGYEKMVLDGGRGVLARSRVVQCELSTRELYRGQSDYLEVLAELEQAGFSTVQLLPGFVDPRTGDLLQFDVIAARVDAGMPSTQ